ncbi:MAG: S41 family peptidase [Bacteroidetes bacterium]|nr:S41 family peptidase [Bacteroidota bacterium]
MDSKKPSGLQVWTPLLFAFILMFGMTLGFNLRDTLRTKRDLGTVIERNDRLEQIIDLINEKYVDTVNKNNLYSDAITGILSHLDPHTVYIPSDELEEVNEGLEGSFYGIGVEFAIIRDTIQVTSVVKGGPSEHAGVETGDQLIKVGDSVVAGKHITSEHIIRMLKGKEDTKVVVELKQPWNNSKRSVTIKRGVVPVYSIDASIMLDSLTGYIKINRFSANTYNEFVASLKELKTKGMKGLVIDLRDNPGGYLDNAKDIADELLPGNKLIVYTEGRRSPRIEYHTDNKSGFEKGEVAILIDENSASASEILAGAVQDWDRGVIIGRRSFGKGLVQEQYDMADGSALRLTVAKYYTPSGRCIQRSYAKGKDAYAEAFVHRFETGELTGKDTINVGDTTKYYTANKRVVYGGGGIKPDVYVPYDTTKLTPGMMNLMYSDDVRNLIWDYYVRHRSTLMEFHNVREFDRKFKADELVTAFLKMQDPVFRRVVEKVMQHNANYRFFAAQMKAQMARILFYSNGYYSITTEDDDVVQKALHVLHGGAYSAIVGR